MITKSSLDVRDVKCRCLTRRKTIFCDLYFSRNQPVLILLKSRSDWNSYKWICIENIMNLVHISMIDVFISRHVQKKSR